MEIHITRNGEPHGPYPEASVREMLAAGQLLPTDLAWHDGADGWKPLSEVLGAAAQPPPTPPQPATPPAGPSSSPQSGGLPKRHLAGSAPDEEKPTDEEQDDPDKISVTRKGEPIGPYSRDKAKEYFAAGQLLPTDWGWHDGMDEWKPLYEVLGMEVLGMEVPAQPAFAPVAAAGKPGKGKKIALIVGIVILLSGLVFAGITYGPDFFTKISGGRKLTPEEKKVVGEYEGKLGFLPSTVTGPILQQRWKLVLLENGTVETTLTTPDPSEGYGEATWQVITSRRQVYVGISILEHVFKIEPNGDLIKIGEKIDGKYTNLPKVSQLIFKKIK